MAFDATHIPSSRLDEQTIASVRDALRAWIADPAKGEPLREALEGMVRDARGKEMLPEQCVVVLKELWGSLPEVRLINDASERVRLQQRVVTMCITEYFGP